MQIVAVRTLRAFWQRHPTAEGPLRAWMSVVANATWRTPADIRNTFNSADFIADNRIIFDIGGNKYRLVGRVSYQYQAVAVKFIGTHSEYDGIDPTTINRT